MDSPRHEVSQSILSSAADIFLHGPLSGAPPIAVTDGQADLLQGAGAQVVRDEPSIVSKLA